ncbi:riboflavin synthase [Alicyclobacillus sp. SO9]|uniref:riboflavin synthase n=1 Tax=Alicyclobacillus sp. SO9 TaxID=2665646 RepID=UPI0018E6F658|nr:riboflavin synthase [Alicyclobacillus sp. SO9]QQE78043.1 riboflavin synthase [Alicyclobacillus sp. SO9]
MFTGLVEEVATVERVVSEEHSAHLRLRAKTVLTDVKIGDSIAINGVCLTVVAFDANSFLVDAVPETMRKTNLGRLRSGSRVNLERALKLSDRLGGHIVSGHVDGTGTLIRRDDEGIAKVLTIETEHSVMAYIANKGSICVDGVSLTVMDTTDKSFRISVIPHTGTATTLLSAAPGDVFNLECDVLAKYVEKLLGVSQSGDGPQSGLDIDMDLLRRTGFA